MYGFKPLYTIIGTLNIITALFSYISKYHPATFILCICSSQIVLAAIFALFPTSVYKTFGSKFGLQVYSLVMLFWMMTAIFEAFFIYVIFRSLDKYGNLTVYIICSAFGLIGLIINHKFTEKLDYSSLESKGKLILTD